MAYEDRKVLLDKIGKLRDGRALVCFFNFDRPSSPEIPGIATQFHSEAKEPLFRVLKESKAKAGVDLCIYTRGGDTNSVWPIVSLLREFDPNFEVLVPFRCHSSGTLVALGAKQIHLGPISELSPIDPSTGNQFNPIDPTNPGARMPISVEDVQAYRNFLLDSMHESVEKPPPDRILSVYVGLFQKLVADVHPLALGNVHRVHQQIKKLGSSLLNLHPVTGRDVNKVVDSLATRFFSHLHMINRQEAVEILGAEQVKFASDELAVLMDELLRAYEDQFALRRPFFLGEHMGDKPQDACRFVGGVIESQHWSYVFETRAKINQSSKMPPNIQLQLPAGQRLPLIPGLPREYAIEVGTQGWVHNKEPKGVTL